MLRDIGRDASEDMDTLITNFVSTMIPTTTSGGDGDLTHVATNFINAHLGSKSRKCSFFMTAIRKVGQLQRMKDINKILQVCAIVNIDLVLCI
jgi:hypothetical protein